MDDPAGPPPPPPSSGGAVREEIVANGVAFLLHPRVQQAPLSQRITFLERKGLSQEEVAEALARVKRQQQQGANGDGSAPLDQLYGSEGPPPPASPSPYPGPPHPYHHGGDEYMEPPPPPPPPPMWHQPGVMLPGAMVAGLALGAGAAHLIRLRRRQQEQEEREQRMLEMEFRERRRHHEQMQHQQHPHQHEWRFEEEAAGPMGDGSFGGSVGGASPFNEGEEPLPQQLLQPGRQLEQEQMQPVPLPMQAPDDANLSLRELARAIETQAQALTALAQASERSRQDLHALLTGQVAAQTADIRAELSTIKQVLLLSASASASGVNNAGALLENGGTGGRLALMAAGDGGASLSSSSSVVEALPTPTPTRTKEGRAAGGMEGTESAFSSPTKEGREEKGEEEEEEEEEEGGQESEEAKAAREAAKAAREAAEAARVHRKKLKRMCEALRGMQAGNAAGALHDAVDMLVIYVNNLIKYPTVPRFRKVALVNQGYKERVAKVQGHEEFLKSLGYAEGAACFEWEGHLAAGQEAKDNLTLLQTALALLTAVKNGEAPAWPELPPAAEEEGEEEQSSLSPTNDDGAPELDEARVQALLGRPGEPLPQVVLAPATAGENKTDSAPASPEPQPPPASASATEAAPEGVAQEGQPQQQQQPQYPKSFMEIMQMAERGETPAGIQQVENRLSHDVADGQGYPSADSAEAPKKPWEKAEADAGQGQEEAAAAAAVEG